MNRAAAVSQMQRAAPPGLGEAWHDWEPAEMASAARSTFASIRANWPIIYAELARRGIAKPSVCAAAIATVAIETASTFRPIHEYGTRRDWAGYDGGADYAGRGFIQLTHKYNYETYGGRIGVDLVGNPDLALDPQVAAAVLAEYFVIRGTAYAAMRHDWPQVRRSVVGAVTNPPGLARLIEIVERLGMPV